MTEPAEHQAHDDSATYETACRAAEANYYRLTCPSGCGATFTPYTAQLHTPDCPTPHYPYPTPTPTETP